MESPCLWGAGATRTVDRALGGRHSGLAPTAPPKSRSNQNEEPAAPAGLPVPHGGLLTKLGFPRGIGPFRGHAGKLAHRIRDSLRTRFPDSTVTPLTSPVLEEIHELAQRLGKTRSAVSQVFGGDGNIRVSTWAEYLFAMGKEVELQLADAGDPRRREVQVAFDEATRQSLMDDRYSQTLHGELQSSASQSRSFDIEAGGAYQTELLTFRLRESVAIKQGDAVLGSVAAVVIQSPSLSCGGFAACARSRRRRSQAGVWAGGGMLDRGDCALQ